MSRVSSLIDESYFVEDINDSSGKLSFVGPQSQNAWSRNPNSKTFPDSFEFVYPTPNREVSRSPASSFKLKTSGTCHTGTENISTSCTTSHTVPHLTTQKESHPEEPTLEEPSSDTVHKVGQLPYLPYGDYVENIHPILDANQTRYPDAPTSARLSITSLDNEAFQYHPGTKAKTPGPIDFSEEEASAEIPSFSDYSLSRKDSPCIIITSTPPKTLKRIVDSVRPRQLSGPRHLKSSEERQDLGDEFEPPLESAEHLEVPPQRDSGQHRKTSSGFSSTFVGARNSATTDLSSSSGYISSQKTHWSRLSRFSKRSSRLSDTADRASMDSNCGPSPSPLKATVDRALQRRRIIGELTSSESEYLNDLGILTYVYLAILGSTQTFDRDRLNKVEDNMLTMIALHEDILTEIKSITQDSIKSTEGRRTLPRLAKHIRYESIDSLKPITRDRKSLNPRALGDKAKYPGLTAEPKEAADVASLFGKMLGGTAATQMGKFSVYEEYGAKYAEMLQACTSATRTIPIWEVVERGIEALVNKVLLQGAVPKGDKKAMTFDDLLIKPIQRICRYPLLFAELESYCPAIDDPESHGIITKVLDRLRGTAHEVNNATNDLEAQARLRRSQHLEDLLAFPDTFRPSFSLIRDLGHAKLCGVLFVAYQARDGGIRGDYMLCALFTSFMLLASPEQGYKRFTIGAIIGLDNIRLDTASSGRGLQCRETPYTWKTIFESNCHLYELLFCACTELEAERWRVELQEASARENQRQVEANYPLASKPEFLFLEVKECAVRSKVIGTFSRGRFVQPFSKFTPQVQTMPVIIKNTHIPVRGDRAESQSNAATSANRSHLQVTTEVIQTLVPERIDRTRIEQAMSEVWTRGTLPFPGMTTSRSGQLIRASASMMRKLSKTSVVSTPSRRSVSQRSRASTIEIGLDGAIDDPFVDHPTTNGPQGLEPADVATELPVFRNQDDTKDRRKVSFSDDLKRPRRKEAEDYGSDTSTVVGNTGGSGTEDRPKKPKSLSRALSLERIRGWFS